MGRYRVSGNIGGLGIRLVEILGRVVGIESVASNRDEIGALCFCKRAT